MNFNYEDPVQNLPDAYKKSTDSNNDKLLRLNKTTTDALESVSNDIFYVLNIDNAKGKTLDDIYGGRVNLQRGMLSDEQYAIRLRAKMMQNIADGSFSDLTEALAYALQCDVADIHIIESEKPNRIIVKSIPNDILFEAGFSIEEIIEMINSMLSAGVTVEEYELHSNADGRLYIQTAAVVVRKRIEIGAGYATYGELDGLSYGKLDGLSYREIEGGVIDNGAV